MGLRLTRSQAIGLFATLALQALLFFSFSEVLQHLSPLRISILVVIELSLLFIAYTVLSKKFIAISLTLWLLLFLNFALTPWLTQKSSNQFITLPKNLHYSFEIVGDAMPGFSGVQNVSTDYLGFRTTKKVDYQNKTAYRIFTIGGSTTEEIYTDDHQTWSAHLERMLQDAWGRNVEVVNAGASGLRAQHHYATLQNVLQYKPDAAIFLVGINDWNHHIKELAVTATQTTDGLGRETSEKRSLLDTLLKRTEISRSILWKSSQLLLARQRITVNDGSYYYNQNHSVTRSDIRSITPFSVSDDYALWIKKISNLCHQQNIRCMFATQPNAYQPEITQDLKRRLWMTPPNEKYTVTVDAANSVATLYNKWLLSFAEATKHPVCDVASHIPPSTDYLIDDCHFNPKGSRLVAETLKSCIARYNLAF